MIVGRPGIPGRPTIIVQKRKKCGRADLYAGFCCRPPLPAWAVATIHLGPLLPVASCDLPADSGEQPSGASCAVLLRAGFTEPRRSPAALVGSYPTLSPLPTGVRWAVCSLWHCPAGHPGWPLATALLCGARTFLSPAPPRRRRQVPRPPGRLVRRDQHSGMTRRRGSSPPRGPDLPGTASRPIMCGC